MNAQARLAGVPPLPLLEASDLTKTYVGGLRSKAKTRTVALNKVSIHLFPGSTLALIGRSGSGKSTLARCLALIEKPDSGEIKFRGVNAGNLSSNELRRTRLCLQMVWQHSSLALNPHFRAVDIVAEPLRIQGTVSKRQQCERALAIMSQLGLPLSIANSRPGQLSGGQRQRLAIARALIVEPAVLILDEALAGLDLPLQREVAKLLLELKDSLSLSYIFVTHDLRMAASLSDEMAVMQCGRIVELRGVQAMLSSPQHSATRQLIEAIPALPFF